MGLKDRIIPVPGLLHQKCRSRCRDRSHCHNYRYARTPTRLHYPARLRVPVIIITRKMVPIPRRASSFLVVFFFVYMLIERRKMRGRQNNNRPINLPKVKHSSQITSTPPHPNLYHTQISIFTYIHTYLHIL